MREKDVNQTQKFDWIFISKKRGKYISRNNFENELL